MGWLFTSRPRSVSIRAFFEKRFNYARDDGHKGTIIDLAVVHRNTAYMAYKIERPGDPERVVALVVLLKFVPKDPEYNFGYKDMDETMGPNEVECPKRIFDLLTPLPPEPDEQYAHGWRRAVKALLDKPKPKTGDRIKFKNPVHFTDGSIHDEFVFRKSGRRELFDYGETHWKSPYRISHWRTREYEILPKQSSTPGDPAIKPVP